MSVLNTANRDHTTSLAFLDPAGGVGIQRYDTLKYRQFDKLTDKQLGFFWRPEEVDVLRDAKDFKDKLRTLAKPIMMGRAIVDGDSYVLTLKKPISDTEKTITITEPGGTAWEMMDKGGKNQDMKKLMMFIAGMVGVPYVQINRLPNSDLKILKEFALLFLA